MAEYEKKVREILLQHECYFTRQGRGDHEMWRSPINDAQFPVDSKIKSRHTANAILKKAGINYRF